MPPKVQILDTFSTQLFTHSTVPHRLPPLRLLLLCPFPIPLPLLLQKPILLRGAQPLQLRLPLRLLLLVALQLPLLRLLLLVRTPQLPALVLACRSDFAADFGPEVRMRHEAVRKAQEVGEERRAGAVGVLGDGGGEAEGECDAFVGDCLVESGDMLERWKGGG